MSRADYAHWNEEADYMWWHEEGKHVEEPSVADDDDYYNSDLAAMDAFAEDVAEWETEEIVAKLHDGECGGKARKVLEWELNDRGVTV